MSGKFNISPLFDVSGNLTIDAMDRYLRDELSPAERSRVEKHIAESEFDREALEGLKNHASIDISREVDDLKGEIMFAAKKKAKTIDSRITRKAYWYAAAGLVALISLSVLMFFMFRNPVDKPQLAVAQPDTLIENTTAANSLKDNSRIADKNNLSEIKSHREIANTVKSEPEKSTAKAEIIPETMQQEAVKEPVEPVTAITIADNDVNVDDNAMMEEFKVGGVANTGDRNDNKENRTMMEERVPINYGIQSKNAIVAYEAESPKEQSEDQIFMVVEQMPEYPGGDTALYRFLAENIHYPDSAREAGIQGRVFITFVVNKDGFISDGKVLRGIGGGCDEEALRVVKSMPNWKPGKQRGKPVRVQFNLPIKFSLE